MDLSTCFLGYGWGPSWGQQRPLSWPEQLSSLIPDQSPGSRCVSQGPWGCGDLGLPGAYPPTLAYITAPGLHLAFLKMAMSGGPPCGQGI